MLAKYSTGHDEEAIRLAQEAFERAFALNPDLPLAHHLYTHFEIEQLGQAEAAMIRLLGRAHDMPNDPDLFAGLVVACRYCGLLAASLAADARARQLDPAVHTSVHYTYLLLNDLENASRFNVEEAPYVPCIMLLQRGRIDEGRAMMHVIEQVAPVEGVFATAADAALDGRAADALRSFDRVRASGFRDPEGLFTFVIVLAHAGMREHALDLLEEVIGAGFVCPQIRHQPWLLALAGDERFERVIARAGEARRQAVAAFRSAGGDRLLGVVET